MARGAVSGCACLPLAAITSRLYMGLPHRMSCRHAQLMSLISWIMNAVLTPISGRTGMNPAWCINSVTWFPTRSNTTMMLNGIWSILVCSPQTIFVNPVMKIMCWQHFCVSIGVMSMSIIMFYWLSPRRASAVTTPLLKCAILMQLPAPMTICCQKTGTWMWGTAVTTWAV